MEVFGNARKPLATLGNVWTPLARAFGKGWKSLATASLNDTCRHVARRWGFVCAGLRVDGLSVGRLSMVTNGSLWKSPFLPPTASHGLSSPLMASCAFSSLFTGCHLFSWLLMASGGRGRSHQSTPMETRVNLLACLQRARPQRALPYHISP